MAKDNHAATSEGMKITLSILILLILVIVGIWMANRALIIEPIYAALWVEYRIVFLLSGLLGHLGLHLDGQMLRQDYLYFTGVLTGVNSPRAVTVGDIGLVHDSLAPAMAIIDMPLIGGMILFVLTRPSQRAAMRRFVFKGTRSAKVYRVAGRVVSKETAGLIEKITRPFGVKPVSTRIENVRSGTSFIGFQSKRWRSTATSAMFDPDLADPRWRPAETPLEFCLRHKITSTVGEAFDQKLTAALSRQIGKRIDTIDKFPVHARAVLALAWLNRMRKVEAGQNLAGDLAELIKPHDTLEAFRTVTAAKVRALVDPVLTPKATAFFNRRLEQHYGWRVAMVAMVAACGPLTTWGGGRAGVLAPSTYLWLKGVDRVLWYCLTNIGMGNFHIEGIAAIEQYRFERFNTPDPNPHVANAIRGVRQYFASCSATDLIAFQEERINLTS